MRESSMLEYIIIVSVILLVTIFALIYAIYIRFLNNSQYPSNDSAKPKWGLFSRKDEEENNLDWDDFDMYQDLKAVPPRIFQSKCIGIQPRTFEDLQKSEENLAESTGTSSGTDEGGGHPPKLKFTLKYNTVKSNLVVHVLGVKNPPKREKGDVAYYVTLRIFPELHRTFHTRGIESGTPLQFNELFEFEIVEANLLDQNLKVTLSFFDRFSHHDIVGDLIVQLAEVEHRGLTLSREILMCKELNKIPTEQPSIGEVMLSLGYLRLTERLAVVVISAKQLALLDSNRRPDPYVEVILFHGGRIIKYKKTSCRIKDCNPVYNESLTFHIPHGILHQSSLLIAVKNDAGITSNDVLLGQVLLGPEATGLAFEHWNEMRVNNKPVARWHKLHSAA